MTVSPGLVIVRITRLAGSALNARVTVWPCLVRHRTTVTVLPRALVPCRPPRRSPGARLASLRTTWFPLPQPGYLRRREQPPRTRPSRSAAAAGLVNSRWYLRSNDLMCEGGLGCFGKGIAATLRTAPTVAARSDEGAPGAASFFFSLAAWSPRSLADVAAQRLEASALRAALPSCLSLARLVVGEPGRDRASTSRTSRRDRSRSSSTAVSASSCFRIRRPVQGRTRSHRHVEDLRRVVVAEIADVDEHQHVTEVVRTADSAWTTESCESRSTPPSSSAPSCSRRL